MKILFAALLLAPPVVAPTAPPAVAYAGNKPFYRGHFTMPCASWRTAREGKGQDGALRFGIYKGWLAGYVSAFNIVGPDNTGNLFGTHEWDDAYAYIDGHCARHPSHEVVDAMHPLVVEFLKRRLRSSPASKPPESKRKATNSMWTTCKDWVQDRDNKILRIAWGAEVRGYLTAYNLWGPDPKGDAVGPVKDDIVDKWLDDWCAGRPPATALLLAMDPMIDHFAAERAAGRLPPAGRGRRTSSPRGPETADGSSLRHGGISRKPAEGGEHG